MCMFQLQDLQDICNIKKERFRIKLEYFNVSEAIKEIVNMNKMQAVKKNIKLEVSICRFIPELLKTDKKRLQQVINNMFTNAIKFSDDGSSIQFQASYA